MEALGLGYRMGPGAAASSSWERGWDGVGLALLQGCHQKEARAHDVDGRDCLTVSPRRVSATRDPLHSRRGMAPDPTGISKRLDRVP